MRSGDVRESAAPDGISARVRPERRTTSSRPDSEISQTTLRRSSLPSPRSMKPRPERWFVRWVIVGRSALWYSAIADVFTGSFATSSLQRIANSSNVSLCLESTDCRTMLYALLTDMYSRRSIVLPLLFFSLLPCVTWASNKKPRRAEIIRNVRGKTAFPAHGT